MLIQDEERRSTKRKRKQLNKQRQKLAEKMNLKMVLKGDGGPIMESNDMFSLSDIKNAEVIITWFENYLVYIILSNYVTTYLYFSCDRNYQG